MKKFLCILALVVTSSVTITSCSEENVQPNNTGGGGEGGSPSSPSPFD